MANYNSSLDSKSSLKIIKLVEKFGNKIGKIVSGSLHSGKDEFNTDMQLTDPLTGKKFKVILKIMEE